MQREITAEQPLLSKDGRIIHEGWARKPYWKYVRSDVASGPYRIKEWDYYAITNFKEKWNICLTFSDLGYAGLFSITFLDYERGKYSTVCSTKLLTRHRTGLGANPEDDYAVSFSDGNMTMAFVKKTFQRHILATAPAMVLPDGRKGLKIDVTLLDHPCDESVNIATSWQENRHCFYYNEKRCAMPVVGELRFGFEKVAVEAGTTLALLDWGRGRWYRESTWHWSCAMGMTDDGHRFAINTGYGFTDRTPASENAIIYDGKVHKLGDVGFTYPEDFTSGVWSIEDEAGRLSLEMVPVMDRRDHIDFKLIKSGQDQVFGHMKGFFVLDDGNRVDVDTLGFAEKVHNKW